MELRTRAPGYEQTRGMFTVGEATHREFPAAGGQRPGRVKLGSSEGSGGPVSRGGGATPDVSYEPTYTLWVASGGPHEADGGRALERRASRNPRGG